MSEYQYYEFLSHTSYQHGALFCAEKNGGAAADIDATLHQPRHTHATELINAGLSLATIRKRLGHRDLQTTLAQGR